MKHYYQVFVTGNSSYYDIYAVEAKSHDCDWPTDNDVPPICKFGYSSCAFLGTDLCDTCVDGKYIIGKFGEEDI